MTSLSQWLIQSIATNTNLYAAILESQTSQLQKGSQPNLVPSGHPKNWCESNMADTSPRTDTSTDMEINDNNQRVMYLTNSLTKRPNSLKMCTKS